MGPHSNSLAATLMEPPAAPQHGPGPSPSPPHHAARRAVGGAGSCSSWHPALGGRSAEAGDVPNPFDTSVLPHAGLLLADALSWQKDSSPCMVSEAGRSTRDRLAAGGSSYRLPSAMVAAVLAEFGPAAGSGEQIEEGPHVQAGPAVSADGAALGVADSILAGLREMQRVKDFQNSDRESRPDFAGLAMRCESRSRLYRGLVSGGSASLL